MHDTSAVSCIFDGQPQDSFSKSPRVRIWPHAKSSAFDRLIQISCKLLGVIDKNARTTVSGFTGTPQDPIILNTSLFATRVVRERPIDGCELENDCDEWMDYGSDDNG